MFITKYTTVDMAIYPMSKGAATKVSPLKPPVSQKDLTRANHRQRLPASHEQASADAATERQKLNMARAQPTMCLCRQAVHLTPNGLGVIIVGGWLSHTGLESLGL